VRFAIHTDEREDDRRKPEDYQLQWVKDEIHWLLDNETDHDEQRRDEEGNQRGRSGGNRECQVPAILMGKGDRRVGELLGAGTDEASEWNDGNRREDEDECGRRAEEGIRSPLRARR